MRTTFRRGGTRFLSADTLMGGSYSARQDRTPRLGVLEASKEVKIIRGETTISHFIKKGLLKSNHVPRPHLIKGGASGRP